MLSAAASRDSFVARRLSIASTRETVHAEARRTEESAIVRGGFGESASTMFEVSCAVDERYDDDLIDAYPK